MDGRVFVWTKPPNPEEKDAQNMKVGINTRHRLMEFCTETLKVPLSTFLDTWPH